GVHEARQPVDAAALEYGQGGGKVTGHGRLEAGAQLQRQVLRQHRDLRALRGHVPKQAPLPARELVERAGRADGMAGDGDLHPAGSSGRVQNVSAWVVGPTPTSSQSSAMVSPGWRT